MLVGAIFGLIIAVKGYMQTEWRQVRRISYWNNFQFGQMSPQMRKLTRIWAIIMVLGFILTGIGLSIGLG